MRYLSLIALLATFLVWPLSTAVSSIPDKPIFEFEGDGQLIFYNTHSHELLNIIYKDEDGNLKDDGLEDFDYIMRCRLTDAMTIMDPKLLALVDHIQDHFGVEKIDIISGYRSPELNAQLRRQKRGVAKRSLHMEGKAIDIRVPGVPTIEVRNFARSLKAGGVGYYARRDYVHVDVGDRVYYW